MGDLSLSVSSELIEIVAQLVAQRAAALLAQRVTSTTPWMTTDETVAYTRIPVGTFEELAARGRIPFHSVDAGRRKLYHRQELDEYLGYDRRTVGHQAMRVDAA